MTARTEKSKIFGTVSAIPTETEQDKEQVTRGTEGKQDEVNLTDLMTKWEQIYKKPKCGEEDRQELNCDITRVKT